MPDIDVKARDKLPIEKNILEATKRAKDLRIIDISDVNQILSSFRWISFSYTTLRALRGPPTCKKLEQILEMSKHLKISYSDEKLIRSLQGLLCLESKS